MILHSIPFSRKANYPSKARMLWNGYCFLFGNERSRSVATTQNLQHLFVFFFFPSTSKVAMNSVKAILNLIPPLTNQILPLQRLKLNIRRKSSICFMSNSDDSESYSSEGGGGGGDKRKQELVAKIAMLQTQKVRLTDFLDERSAYLTQFAEDANVEFDEIGENALKELDEAGARIMGRLEGQMQDFEETSNMNREEIEKNEKVLEEFEDQIIRDRNEGLFFKNLQGKTPPPKPQAKANAKVEAEKLREIAKGSAGSKIRKNSYLGLMSLMVIGIANAIFASAEIEWRKVAALGLIFMGLLLQFIYEKSLSSTTEETDKK